MVADEKGCTKQRERSKKKEKRKEKRSRDSHGGVEIPRGGVRNHHDYTRTKRAHRDENQMVFSLGFTTMGHNSKSWTSDVVPKQTHPKKTVAVYTLYSAASSIEDYNI